jgi:hypothetical protein
LRQRFGEERLDRRGTHDGQLWIERVYPLPDAAEEGPGVHGQAARHDVHLAQREVLVGYEHLRARGFAQAVMPHVTDDSNDLDAPGHRHAERLADRIEVGEVESLHRLVDDHDRAALVSIEAVQEPPANQRDAESAEVTGNDGAVFGAWTLGGGRCVPPGNLERQVEVDAQRAHRQCGDGTGVDDAGKGGYLIDQGVVKLTLSFGCAVMCLGQRQGDGDDILRAKSRIDVQ